MGSKQNIILDNLLTFISNMKEVDNYNEILNHIFDYHLLKQNSDLALNNLLDHLKFAFDVNPLYLVKYLVLENFNADKTNIEYDYHDDLDYIHFIKMKYGSTLRDLIKKEQDPFMIVGADVNVRKNESTHIVRFIRSDGEHLNFNFNPYNLMNVNLALTQGLTQSIERGIFSLDKGLVEEYISKNEEINKLLKELLESENN